MPSSEQLELEEAKRQLALYKRQDLLLEEMEQTLYKMKEITLAAVTYESNQNEIKRLVRQMETYEKTIHSLDVKLEDLRRIAASSLN